MSAVIDTRFSTKPTALKLAAMIVAIIATVVALFALWRLDRVDGRRMHRLIPARWRFFTATDVVVVLGFLSWHIIGANSSDDGYILQMARVADARRLHVELLPVVRQPRGPVRLVLQPARADDPRQRRQHLDAVAGLICALVCWLLLSREVLPRLGPAVASSKAAMWAAGLVLLAAWMPFNNGLRPEGQIATGALITYVLIERAIISGRLTPAALAIVAAAFTLGIQPTGLIAVAALLAGGRPLLRILVRRHRVIGTWPLVAPLLAAGFVVLTVVFADQTLATVLEATRIRTAIGPSQAWYTENLRYYYLILPTVDGSLSRRFGFLITALSLFASMFIMLRRKRIPGVARGPVWRLMGIIFGTMFFLMFTPTKWVHHFGLFAAVGAAMAAVATVLVSPSVLRWSRNRMAFVSAVFFLLALCFASTNGWWYVSSYGVPFNNAMPKIDGITVSTIFFALFAVTALYAALAAFRARDHGEGRIARALTAAPIPVSGGLHGGGVRRARCSSVWCGSTRPTPMLRRTCGRSSAAAGWPTTCSSNPTPTTASCGRCPATTGRWDRSAASSRSGFTPNGVPEHIVAEAIRMTLPQPGTDYDWDAPTKLRVNRASTARRCRCRTGWIRRGFPWPAASSTGRSSRAG